MQVGSDYSCGLQYYINHTYTYSTVVSKLIPTVLYYYRTRLVSFAHYTFPALEQVFNCVYVSLVYICISFCKAGSPAINFANVGSFNIPKPALSSLIVLRVSVKVLDF